MRKTYETPQVSIDTFEANEYIAVCYSLACDWEAANTVEQNTYHTYSPNPTGNQVNHGAAGCGTATNQYITVTDAGRVVIRELSADQGWLDCDVTSAGGADAIVPGAYVTWNTYGSSGRTWHHQGTAVAEYPGHPNRS